MEPTLHFVGDTFEDKAIFQRHKVIHSSGLVGKVTLQTVANVEGFTGIFASGSDYGIIRFSVPLNPVEKHKTAPLGNDIFIPAMAMKFLRDGVPSGNTFGMKSVDGQDSWNFFKYDLSNHIPNPATGGTKIAGKKFE